ncbi:NAD(P)/FAD-dependent oxidoreductase [Derxia lacustris]|uniref:NAD(P)/FAD-dependent oxidoreductase n=1 Tax=Derxia lacustris TaxID=764842 RepID=UPI000A17832C|nr:NAD(P)-binding protein [Derxia lacustris]
MTQPPKRIAIVGAGIAGSACARQLALAGLAPVLFDKARGAGGRMSTRRGEHGGADGRPQPFAFDHGAQYFTARHPDFIAVVDAGADAGWIAHWAPRLAGEARAGSLAPPAARPDRELRHVAVPGMPELARRLAEGLPLRTQAQVTALERDGAGWRLRFAPAAAPASATPAATPTTSAAPTDDEGFDAVLLALPAEQAAALLAAHRADWAAAARATPMLPCWTLMAITDAPDWPYDAAWPTRGPLAWIARNDSKPGRPREPGRAHWIAQASADWSQTQLELDPAEAAARLVSELRAALGPAGARLALHHAVAHRWRYARPAEASPLATGAPWWDAALSLGACGDFLGGPRVEAAFLNGRALAQRLLAG